MSENGRALLERIYREAVAKRDGGSLPSVVPPTIHCTELPAAQPSQSLAVEWNLYRRLVEQLLADGNQGRWVLLKDEQVLGIFDTQAEALAAGYQRYLRQPFLVHQIQERERLLHAGCHRPCPR